MFRLMLCVLSQKQHCVLRVSHCGIHHMPICASSMRLIGIVWTPCCPVSSLCNTWVALETKRQFVGSHSGAMQLSCFSAKHTPEPGAVADCPPVWLFPGVVLALALTPRVTLGTPPSAAGLPSPPFIYLVLMWAHGFLGVVVPQWFTVHYYF